MGEVHEICGKVHGIYGESAIVALLRDFGKGLIPLWKLTARSAIFLYSRAGLTIALWPWAIVAIPR